jgi:hypothetical protein
MTETDTTKEFPLIEALKKELENELVEAYWDINSALESGFQDLIVRCLAQAQAQRALEENPIPMETEPEELTDEIKAALTWLPDRKTVTALTWRLNDNTLSPRWHPSGRPERLWYCATEYISADDAVEIATALLAAAKVLREKEEKNQ